MASPERPEDRGLLRAVLGRRWRAWGFRSFQGRLLAVLLAVLGLVLTGVFLAVDTISIGSARRAIAEALDLTAVTFERTLDDRRVTLLDKVRLLSGDFAFKQAYATGEHGTLLSALDNHLGRVGADVMLLTDLDGLVLADTLHPAQHGQTFSQPALLDAAAGDERGEVSGIALLDGRPYQLVVVPLYTPEPSAWVIIGFALGDALAQRLEQQTHTQVSLVWQARGGAWRVFASTLEPAARTALLDQLAREPGAGGGERELALPDGAYLSRRVPLHAGAEGAAYAVLQRSLDEALGPHRELRRLLAGIFALGTAIAIACAVFVARRVTRPVRLLATGAQELAEGRYMPIEGVTQKDELGRLAQSFNTMIKGLAERDRVRAVLGKVVSPAVAEELLSRRIELGGEERQASVLFSDIRGFTSLSEHLPPAELLALLNAYFGRMSMEVDGHGGVVDKYIGDAVMALFGVPLAHDDDPARAVACALDMCSALTELNERFAARGWPRLAIGVGIHSGLVVAGNMGSESRWNYTVLGDAVNLASRLEGLCKVYGASIVVSRATRAACPGIAFRELDRVGVKGRAEAVEIHQPLGPFDALPPEERTGLRRYGEALVHYRARDWDRAETIFAALAAAGPEVAVYRLYAERCRLYRSAPPPADWAAVTRYDSK